MTNKISVIVATINKGNFLESFLKSLYENNIINQKDIEILVVNNSTNKKDGLIIEKLCSKYNVIYLKEKRKGKPFAINTGIKKAQGDYLAFTDDDIIVTDSRWLYKMRNSFILNKQLGYVSGNVIALNQKNKSEIVWEKKGGLSKGEKEKYWSKSFLNKRKYKYVPRQFNKICAGANCMIPRKVIDKIGPYNVLLESGIIGHGTTLEIGYRIAKFKYELLYLPDSIVYHAHPTTEKSLKKKMLTYGIGDTAYQMSIFLEFKDIRCLFWSLFGHAMYTIKNKLIPRLIGKYSFPVSYILKGLIGNIIGGWLFSYDYLILKGKKRKKEYLINYYK